MASAADTDSGGMNTNAPPTPVASPKRQKTRVSPRGISKKDYKALEDPFPTTNATDGEGNTIFEADKSSSEDSAASDEEYGKTKGAVTVKESAGVVV